MILPILSLNYLNDLSFLVCSSVNLEGLSIYVKEMRAQIKVFKFVFEITFAAKAYLKSIPRVFISGAVSEQLLNGYLVFLVSSGCAVWQC